MMRRLTLIIVCATLAGGVADAGDFLAGAASATVNPGDGVFMGGYDQNRLSAGVHDDLYAKAVVFSDGETAVALVVVDSIGLQYDTVTAIREAASKAVTALALPPGRIVVQSTHSHCSPDVIGIWGPDQMHTGRNAAYMARLTETAAKQVARAAESMQAASIVFAQTECTGWAVNDSEPDVIDNSVTVLQCLDKKGASIATLTNFACHPTVLDGDTAQVSADWVGAFYKTMAALPGEHLYLQGAVGCWIQPKTPERTFALAEKYGTDLGKKTLAALEHTTGLKDTKVRAANKTFGMPVDNIAFRLMGELKLVPREFGLTVQTEVAWFAIGPAQFATHPAETAPAFATQTRELMDSGPKFILGLGLDELGYICTPKYHEPDTPIPHAKYLASMSVSPKAGEAMMTALEAIIP